MDCCKECAYWGSRNEFDLGDGKSCQLITDIMPEKATARIVAYGNNATLFTLPIFGCSLFIAKTL